MLIFDGHQLRPGQFDCSNVLVTGIDRFYLHHRFKRMKYMVLLMDIILNLHLYVLTLSCCLHLIVFGRPLVFSPSFFPHCFWNFVLVFYARLTVFQGSMVICSFLYHHSLLFNTCFSWRILLPKKEPLRLLAYTLSWPRCSSPRSALHSTESPFKV